MSGINACLSYCLQGCDQRTAKSSARVCSFREETIVGNEVWTLGQEGADPAAPAGGSRESEEVKSGSPQASPFLPEERCHPHWEESSDLTYPNLGTASQTHPEPWCSSSKSS